MGQQQNWNSTSSLPNTYQMQPQQMPVGQGMILQPTMTQVFGQPIGQQAQPTGLQQQFETPKKAAPSPFQDLDPLGTRGSPASFVAPKSGESMSQVSDHLT